MSVSRIFFPTLFVLALLTACGGESEPPSAASSNSGLTLTPDYLQGEWCLTHTDANGEIEEENVNYRFGADGSLAVQTSSQVDTLKEGFSWAMQDGALKMSHQPGTSSIERIDPDEFVLKYFVNVHYRRGACIS